MWAAGRKYSRNREGDKDDHVMQPKGLLLLCALVLLTMAASRQPAQQVVIDKPLPTGLVVVIENNPQAERLDVGALNNPSISGVALQIHWSDLEPTEGKPDWAKLDQLFAAAEASGKWVQLLIFPGFFSPSWALQGVQSASFPIQYGPGRGTVEKLPVPWGNLYLTRWFAFLRLLSARYGSNPAFRVMAADGPTSVSAEFTLPSSPEDVRIWLSLGYTPRKYLEAWQRTFRTVSTDFPRQYISLSLGFGLNINDKGRLDATERKRTKQEVIDEGIRMVGRRFALQYSNLDGNSGPDKGPPGTELIISYNGRIITGFQLRTSCLRNSGNMGAEGDPPLALRKAIDKGLQPNSSGHHVNYLEIYKPDVLADQMQPVLRYGASLFK